MTRNGARLRCILIALLGALFLPGTGVRAGESVILLHGLCRTKRSMVRMEKSLSEAGYHVVNLGYPSRSDSILKLSGIAIEPALEQCRQNGASTIHFVTHSLGGILVRSYLARHHLAGLGGVVMLGPPNQGSEVVDRLRGWRLFKAINGPAGEELGTGALPSRLGPVHFRLGIIAGSRSINWINSVFIPGRDDGKVSIERTKVTGMSAHLVLPTTHPFLMRDREAIRQTIRFLHTGTFLFPRAPVQGKFMAGGSGKRVDYIARPNRELCLTPRFLPPFRPFVFSPRIKSFFHVMAIGERCRSPRLACPIPSALLRIPCLKRPFPSCSKRRTMKFSPIGSASSWLREECVRI